MNSCFPLSIPSKTFIIGEYGVPQGGTALIATHGPCFVFSLDQKKACKLSKPASDLLAMHPLATSVHPQIADPHQSLGGFGRSTAEFLAAYLLLYPSTLDQIDTNHLRNTYRSCCHPVPASGADLLAQTRTGLVAVYPDNRLETLSWPFEDLHLTVAATGHKEPTDLHLLNTPLPDCHRLKLLTQDAVAALKSKNASGFCRAINDYQQELQSLGLSAQSTQALLASTQAANVHAAKGCGALGMDVVLWVHRENPPNMTSRLIQTVR